MAVFDRKSEKQIVKIYIDMLIHFKGYSHKVAKEAVKGMLKRAKEGAIRENTANLPPNYGNYLLDMESVDPRITSMFAEIRDEGVTDEDIRFWWNMNELERRMSLQFDNLTKIEMFIHYIKNGYSEAEAAIHVKKYNPTYGHSKQTTKNGLGYEWNDRALPFELKNRVNEFIQRMSQIDPVGYKNLIDNSTSFNAMIRNEIIKGNV